MVSLGHVNMNMHGHKLTFRAYYMSTKFELTLWFTIELKHGNV